MVRLTLTANELAIVVVGLHYIAADSHYLQIKTASAAVLDAAASSEMITVGPRV